VSTKLNLKNTNLFNTYTIDGNKEVINQKLESRKIAALALTDPIIDKSYYTKDKSKKRDQLLFKTLFFLFI
jgi:hypothetical protein